jgi:hypothetical protein
LTLTGGTVSFEKLRKIFFSLSLVLSFTACETQTEEQMNVEAQNQRVYVRNLENRIIELVDRVSGTDGEGLDVSELEAEIRTDVDGAVESDSSIALELAASNDRQARIEAMLIAYQADMQTLIGMYDEALESCGENCVSSTPVAVLEDRALIAAQDLEETVAADIELTLDEVEVETGIAMEEVQVEPGEAIEGEAISGVETETTGALDILSEEELAIVADISELRRRSVELESEKEEIFESLNSAAPGYSLDYVSERVQTIDVELATISAQREARILELGTIRLAGIQAE